MEYKDFFSPKTLEKLNTKSAENLKTMLGDKSLMQTIMSSSTLMSQISKAEEPYKTQLENLAVEMVKELYPIIDEEGIVLDAKIASMSDIGRGLDESITPESRRRIINAITQGAALRGAFAFYLFKEHLDDLDPTLVNNYNQIMKNSFGIYDDENAIAMMLAALAQGQKMAGGSSKVIINEIRILKPGPFETLKRNLIKLIEYDKKVIYPNSPDEIEEANEVIEELKLANDENDLKSALSSYTLGEEGNTQYYFDLASYKEKYNNPLLNEIKVNEAESGITIQARAANFPMLVHELIKGLYELLSLQGFKGDKASNQAVADKVDLLKNEPSDIRYGKFIFDALNKVFINSEYNDPRIREFFLTEIYQLDDEGFIQFIENAVNDELTQTQTQWANSTLRDIASDLKADDYESTGLDEIKVNAPRIDPKLLSLSNAKREIRDLTGKEISPLNLKLGKFNISGNEQGIELTWEEGSKLLSSTTRQNVTSFFNGILNIEPSKIYVGIVPRFGKAAKSFYIVGEYNNIPLIISRKETTTPGAGQTFLISSNYKDKFHNYSNQYGTMSNEEAKQNIIDNFNLNTNQPLNEYSEKTINTTIERWKAADPETDENTAKQLIQRFDQIKSGLSSKLNIVVLPDALKQGQNYLNIDKYSFDDMGKLIKSLPENPEKVKKDAIGRFVQRDGIDKATAQSYVARFMSNVNKLKYGVANGTEDDQFTKEEVNSFIPKKLLNNNAYLDPRVWGWVEFEQMLDALFPSQKAAGEEGENLASTDADKIYDKGGIEIYKGDDVEKCISYNPVSAETKRKKYGWCVTVVKNTNYDNYRFGGGRLQSPTFYFVFDRSKDSSPEHATFNDEWHAFVIQVEQDQSKYIVTGANNRGDIDADSWESISKIVPSETWAKIKGLKDYFKPIGLSKVELSRKFASGKNLSLSEFKALDEDGKTLYIQGKAQKNQISNDILEILPQYKLTYDGRSTTLANIAIDSGQKMTYTSLKNNEALAKRYAIVSSRYHPNDPLPLPFIKYLDEKEKLKYLEKYDDYLSFEYIEKYFGQAYTEKYVNEQVKKLDYLPQSAIKYIKDPKLKTLFGIYSKLFDSWKDGNNTNLSDEALESTQNMPEQNVDPIPINLKQWVGLSPQEKKIIIELTEKYNQNPNYSTLAYASPFIIKDGAETYTLLPGTSDNYNYTDWVLLDKNNNVIKKLPEGTSLGGMDLISGYPTAEDNFKRVWNLKDLKIEK